MDDPILTDMREYPVCCEESGYRYRSGSPMITFLCGIIQSSHEAVPGCYCDTNLPCAEYVDGVVCGGTIHIMRTDVPRRIVWRCSLCGRNGVIVHWKDRSYVDAIPAGDKASPDPRRIVEIVLTEVEYRMLSMLPDLDIDSAYILRLAVKSKRGIVLYATPDEWRFISSLIERILITQQDGMLREIYETMDRKIYEAVH